MKKNNAIHITSALAVICLAGSMAYGQEEKIEDQDLLNMMESVSEAQPIEVVEVEGSLGGTNSATVMDDLVIPAVDESEGTTDGNLISVRLNRVSLEEAIDLFAQLSGANIIVPELTDAAQISVNLKDVEWRPALQSILDTYNYELYQRVSGSNVFSVRRRPAGAPEPQVVETFTLNYATVPNAAALVRELLPPDAKVSEFASRNMMVVKSTESSLSEVRAVLE
jgi:type II secretory pathway component GspD/PulD (secretin)